jgi:hypothetical protein
MYNEHQNIPVRTVGDLYYNPQVRQLTPREDDTLQRFLSEGLRRDWIRKSQANVSCDLIFEDKKDGGLRVCVNHIPLNRASVKEVYGPPPQRLLRYEIAKARWFSKFDLKDAYYNVRLAEEDTWKTTFRCKYGLYKFMVLPQG